MRTPHKKSLDNGVTAISGHRRLAMPDTQLIQQCASALEQVPRSDTLLTGLAEGADQLVTELALQMGWHVCAILPMPVSEYEKDFPAPVALDRFRSLLSRCHRVIEIPLAAAVDPDIWANSSLHVGVCREQQYRNLGRYLVAHAQTMLLLWDGDASAPKPGGTAEVKLMCDATLARRDDSDWYGVRRVIHIPVERRE